MEKEEQILEKLLNKNTRSIAICMHNNPDGDSIGSARALEIFLQSKNKEVEIIFQTKAHVDFAPIIGEDRVGQVIIPSKRFDVLVLLDCSDLARTINVYDFSNYIIVIDHHKSSKPFGDIYYYEPVSATGMLIYKIIKHHIKIDAEIATSLYLSIRSDTNSFKNCNTDYPTMLLAARLIKNGADIQIINNMYDYKTLTFTKLMGDVLENIQYNQYNKIAYLVVNEKQIKKAKSNFNEASSLVDILIAMKGIKVAYLFLVNDEKIIIKARSQDINVSEILSQFGGGGHITAAGAFVESIDTYSVIEHVLKITKQKLNERS